MRVLDPSCNLDVARAGFRAARSNFRFAGGGGFQAVLATDIRPPVEVGY